MKKPGKRQLMQAAAFLLCLVVACVHIDDFGASEFSGGRITGPIFSMFDYGSTVLGLAALLTFFYPRIASTLALAATLLCLPFYLYITLPGPFRFFFPGNYSVPLSANLVWNTWAITGLLTLAGAAFVSVRSFSAVHQREQSETHN